MGPSRRLTPGPSRRRVAALGLAAVVSASGCGAGGDTPGLRQTQEADVSSRPTVPAGDDAPSDASRRDSLVSAVLQRQAVALADRDRAGFLADWAGGPSAQRQGSRIYLNLVSLGVAGFDPRPVHGTTHGGGSAWVADVDVAWQLAGTDTTPIDSTVHYVFTEHGGRPLVSAVAPAPDARLPIWLTHHLSVRRGARTLAAAADAETAGRVGRLLDDAVGAVGDVLPGWHGRLVAYAPGTARQFAALIDARPRDYAGIAAVTTTTDGSHDQSAPLVIVVNPAVFDKLGPVGAHVVVTHEATHVATDAATVAMPLWVAEGFADYVGIGSVDVPVPVAARAALRVVRRQGAPAALPADGAFVVGGSSLEVTYEEAWLATSLIARRYGRSALVAFYREVEAHPDDIDGAFTTVLHTSRSAFTRSWRAHLVELARGT